MVENIETSVLERLMVNRAIRESEQDKELRRDVTKCIDIISYKYKEDDKDNTCVICTDKFHKDQDITMLSCNHVYHKDCIKEWGHYKQECPLCKKSIPLVKENIDKDKDGIEQTNTTME